MSTRLSVVIPAHNESTVIGRLLNRLVDGARSGQLEVIVVANGCTDDTASIARSYGVFVVVEVEAASKVIALNAGDAVARSFPRAYVDADVEVDLDTLLSLAATLEAPGGPLAAAPLMKVDASRSSWAVRAHYRIWELTNYRQHEHIGSGVYALSAAGRSRFGAFPELIADDRFVQQLFARAERGTAPIGSFTVHAPTGLGALIHRSTRASAGIAQLRAAGVPAHPDNSRSTSGVRALVPRVARRPALWPAFAVYCLAYLVPRVLARKKIRTNQQHIWERDETSRR
jgi:glycosyltransferase involved in cell wall biosynthesis